MAHQQPGPSTLGSSGPSWGGDGTLHAYCYDYMVKRGWTATASAFAADAGIIESEWQGPPIEAPQGLLYEWWAVFWDVFVARSQKTGQRNVHADSYVEAVRAKREPLVINFAGPNAPAPITMPRSLSHTARPPPANHAGPRPTHTHPGQLHVLEQQQLQQQMQQGRAPIPGQRPLNGPPPPQYHLQPPPPPPGPPSQHLQGPPPLPQHLQHPGGPPPPPPGGAPYPPGAIPQPLMHPYQSSSAQSSPHLQHAQHPYANGRPQGGPGGPPPPSQHIRQQGGMQQELLPGSNGHGPMAPAFAQSMAAVGLAGRDPESLNGDEQNAVAAQMRRIGALPTLPSSGPPGPQHLRGQPQRVVSQRMHPDQQQQLQQRQQYPPQGMNPQQEMQARQQQQMLQQQAQQREREHFAQQQRLGGPPGPGGPPHQQMQYNPGQVGSPASPNYSNASPYATPLAQHMTIPPSQGGPPQGSPQSFQPPLPPPSRGANPKGRGGAKMSPAPGHNSVAAKRGGANLEDPSPRSRKRVRGGTKDEEMMGMGGGGPETPNFDGSGPSSPGGMMGMPGGQYPGGPPYRPSPSPSQQLQDQSTRGALDALQISASQNARMLAQQSQQHQQQLANEQMMRQANEQMFGPGGGGMGEMVNGDMGGGGGGPTNGHGGGANGSISRPGSSAGYLQPPLNNGANGLSPLGGSPANPNGPNAGPSPRPNSPGLHITLPPPSLGLSSSDLTPGGSRPFAGAPQSITPAPIPSDLPIDLNPSSSNGIPVDVPTDTASFNFNASGDNDLYADLSLDFEFSDFLVDGDT